jgi:hypothetical protein
MFALVFSNTVHSPSPDAAVTDIHGHINDLTYDELSTQSIFDPIQEKDVYRIKDLAIVEAYLKAHLESDVSFLSGKRPVREEISPRTVLKYDIPNIMDISGNTEKNKYLLPVTVEKHDEKLGNKLGADNYWVYISIEPSDITVYTSDEFYALRRKGLMPVHSTRRENAEIKAFIEHELWTDIPISQILENGALKVYGEFDPQVINVSNFLKALGADSLSMAFLREVRQGRVYLIDEEAVVRVPGFGPLGVSDPRVSVDHASNLGIYVRDRGRHEYLSTQKVLLHEVMAKAGVPGEVNDNASFRDALNEAFSVYTEGRREISDRLLEKFRYRFERALKGSGMDKSPEELDMAVDLDSLRDRDLSMNEKKDRLSRSVQEITAWKIARNREEWDAHHEDTPALSLLEKETLRIYNKYRLYELSVRSILEFAFQAFDGDNYPVVRNTVEEIIDIHSGIDLDRSPDELTPSNFHEVARDLSELKFDGSFSNVSNINFVINRLVFDFFRGERRVSELLWIAEEIQREREYPGAGRLPVICAMQDIHGAASRAMALVGFAAGLPPDILDSIENVQDPSKKLDKLKELLSATGIDLKRQDIRFIGMNDLYDRGEDPVGAFRLIEWLSEVRKLKFVTGNHDHWRAMGVLGVHRYFRENYPDLDYKDSDNKGHHPAFWAEDAWVHAGWGPTEIDQENEVRVNRQIKGINSRLRNFNRIRRQSGELSADIELFEEISLRPYRETFAKNLKVMKKYNDRLRRGIDVDENIMKGLKGLEASGGLSREQSDRLREGALMPLPDSLEITLSSLRARIREYNEKIRKINIEHNLGIKDITVKFVNYDNYHKDPDIIDRTLWQMKRFRLFYIDIFGFLHLHSVLPFNEGTRQIDVEYQGQTGLQALELMQAKVQIFFEKYDTIPDTPQWRRAMWEEIGDVLSIVNSWYSDKTKIAKPGRVNDFVKIGGISEFSDVREYTADRSFYSDRRPQWGCVFGHNERKKFNPDDLTDTPLPWMFPYVQAETLQILIDWQMSEGYSEQGGIFTIFKRDEKGRITGPRAWGFKKSKGRVIEDITAENLNVLSREEKDLLLDLSSRDIFTTGQKQLLRKLAREDVPDMSEAEKAFLVEVASDPGTYSGIEDEKSRLRLENFLHTLAAGERMGLSPGQKKMIKNMSDGEWFMRWFQIKSLKQVYQDCDALVNKAGSRGRDGKMRKLRQIRNRIADELEKFGILVRPNMANALKVIADLEGKGVFSDDEFFTLRVEEEKYRNYAEVLHEKDMEMTLDNMKKEVALLRETGFVEETAGGYRATPLAGGLDNVMVREFIERIPEIKKGYINTENAAKIHDEAVRVKADLIHEKGIVDDVMDTLLTSERDLKGVYHLIPVEFIPLEQRWIVQRIRSHERSSGAREKIRILTEEEYKNFDSIALSLLSKGYLVDIALINPTEQHIEKLGEKGLKGRIKALVFEQEEYGNFQQLEGILLALKALYNSDRNELVLALSEIYTLLSGADMTDRMKQALIKADINDPVSMFRSGIVFALPPVEIRDWKRLRELNSIMQKVLMQA